MKRFKLLNTVFRYLVVLLAQSDQTDQLALLVLEVLVDLLVLVVLSVQVDLQLNGMSIIVITKHRKQSW